jgi:hypothetical protein
VDFGVVVGVEHYPHFRSLQGAINDARDFHGWLCDKDGGNLDPRRVKLISSNLEAKTPVQDEIDQMLVEVLDAAYALKGARRLYFYFSGHGAANDSEDDVALLLTRWSTSLARLALSTERYSSALCGAGLFQEVAIFVDCCRSVSVPVVGVPPTITRVWEAPCSTSKFIAYATEARKPAFEFPESDRWQGLFTRCLLSILKGNPSGVRASTLKDQLEGEVASAAAERGIYQRANVYNGFHKLSCFGQSGKLPVLELRFATRRGTVVLRNGDLQVVAEHEADDRPWRLTLPAGLYQIEGGRQDAIVLKHDGREVPHVV